MIYAIRSSKNSTSKGGSLLLILSRKQDQSILIGDDIKITIVELKNNTVKIGIDAPRDLIILREELYLEIAAENKKAVAIDLDSLSKLPAISPQAEN